jgi:hypothetical protein
VVDLFDEVDEQLRSDRYQGLVRRVLPWVTAIMAAAIVGYFVYWGFKLYQDRRLETATSQYQQGVDALSDQRQADAASHFKTAADGPAAYKSLALMQQGGLSLAAGRYEEAAKLYDEAANAAPNLIFGDLARLKAALALLDHAPFPQLQMRLTPLTDSKRPYWAQAKEALAMAELLAGRTKAAREDLNALSLRLGVPDDVRQRSAATVQAIDGGGAAAAIAASKTTAPASAPAAPAGAAQ